MTSITYKKIKWQNYICKMNLFAEKIKKATFS